MVSDVLRRRIVEIMADRRMTKRELSLASGMNDTLIKAILRGKSQHPRIDSVLAITHALDISISDLLEVPPKPLQDPHLLAIRLQAAAEEVGEPPSKMAELAGVTEAVWLAWVRGVTTPSCKAMIKLCDAIPWLKLDWLYRGDPDPMPVNRYIRLRVRVEAALDAAKAAALQESEPEAGDLPPHEGRDGA